MDMQPVQQQQSNMRIFTLAMIGILIMLLAGCWVEYGQIRIYQNLKHSGKIINSTVIDKYVLHGKGGGNCFVITYTTGFTQYRQVAAVNYDVYNSHEIGSTIPIICNPDRPDEFQVGTTPKLNLALLWLIIFCFVFFGCVFLIGYRQSK